MKLAGWLIRFTYDGCPCKFFGAGFSAGAGGEIASQSIAAGELTISSGADVLTAGAANAAGALIGGASTGAVTKGLTSVLSDAGSPGTGKAIKALGGRMHNPIGFKAPNVVSPSETAVGGATEVIGGATATCVNGDSC